MTLDEAIAHAREKSAECGPCAEDHRQLAEWLEELRSMRPEVERLTDLVDGATYGHARRPTGWRVIEERDRLRAESVRLTKERDEARAAMALVVEGLSEARANRSGPTIRPHLEAVWGLLIDQGIIK